MATQPRMLAALSAAWVLPGLFGPAIAGIVASATTWRLVFMGLLPLVAVSLAVTLPPAMALGRRETPSGERSDIGGRLPLAIAVAAGAGLTLAGLGLVGDQAPSALALLVIGLAVGLPAFTRLVPPGTLRARPVMPVAVLLRGLLTFTFAGAEAYLPVAFVVVRGTSAAEAGLAYAPLTVTVPGEAPPEGEGAASAGLQLADILGTALGAGVGGALIAILADSTAEAMDPGRTAAAVGAVFAVEIAVGLVGLVLSGQLERTVPAGVTSGIIGDPA